LIRPTCEPTHQPPAPDQAASSRIPRIGFNQLTGKVMMMSMGHHPRLMSRTDNLNFILHLLQDFDGIVQLNAACSANTISE
jgi:hypothetical protein